jgi:hypothetical protein
LALTDLDLGSYVVALSPHRIVAAPYHRLGESILKNEGILRSSPASALPELRTLGVNYVVLCNDRPDAAIATASSLRGYLLSGRPVDHALKIEIGAPAALGVWQISDQTEKKLRPR